MLCSFLLDQLLIIFNFNFITSPYVQLTTSTIYHPRKTEKATIKSALWEIVLLDQENKIITSETDSCNQGIISLHNTKANSLTPKFLDEIIIEIIRLYYVQRVKRIIIKSIIWSKTYPAVFSSWMRLDEAAKYNKGHLVSSYLEEVIDWIYALWNNKKIPITVYLEWLWCWGGLEIALNVASNNLWVVIVDKDCVVGLPELRKWFIPWAGWIPLWLKIFGIKNIVVMLIKELVVFSKLPDQEYHNWFLVKWESNETIVNEKKMDRIDLSRYNRINLDEQMLLLENAWIEAWIDYSDCVDLIRFCVNYPNDIQKQRILEFEICKKLFSRNKVIIDLTENFKK